jgi:putative hydrolase of the HAD superfamily
MKTSTRLAVDPQPVSVPASDICILNSCNSCSEAIYANRHTSIIITAPMIRVVTFDAAGTLIRLVRPPGLVYADTARRFGYDLDPVRVQNAFRIAWESFPEPPESDTPRPDDDCGWWRGLVAETMNGAGYRIEPFDDYFETVYEQFRRPGVWELFPGVAGILSELRRLSIRLGMISNFDRRLYDVLACLNVRDLFEHVIISSEIGIRKPAARIFEVAVRRFAVAPGEILHVGNEPDADFAGASRAGFQALLVGGARADLAARIARVCQAVPGAL